MDTATRLVMTASTLPTSDEIGVLLHNLCLTRAPMRDAASILGWVGVHVLDASALPSTLTRTIAGRVITVTKGAAVPIMTEEDEVGLAMQEPSWA